MQKDEGVNAIPMTSELRGLQVAFAEAVIEGMMAGAVDDELGDRVAASFKALIMCITRLMPDPEIDPLLIEAGSLILAEATADAFSVVVEEIRKNKVLFDNRQVLANAIRGEMIDDNRSFIIADAPPKTLVDDITPYTSDKKVIAAYNKMRRELTNERKVMRKMSKKGW